MKTYKISEQAVFNLVNYLASRPFVEVSGLVSHKETEKGKLISLVGIEEEKPEENTKEVKKKETKKEGE